MGRVTTRRPIVHVSGAATTARPDTLVVEEPLEIRLNGTSLTVTMRTPGHDVELTHGFLLGEGIIAEAEEVVSARYCAGTDPDGRNTYNVLDVALRSALPVTGTRNFLSTSACGVCGKASLDQVRVTARHAITASSPAVRADTLAAMPATLRKRQRVFAATGGLHAAGLFTADGSALVVREDVGRHNAVDKVLGWALLHKLIPARDAVLIVSGRASFELVQKAVMAGVGMLGAVSAPSSLAVDLAAEAGLTLIGFLRGDSMNIYTCPDRLAVPAREQMRAERA